MSLASWANQRLSTILGTEVSDVVDYLVGIEDDGELADFVSGMLPGGSESGAFIAELKRKKEQERKGATAADVGQERQYELSGVVGNQRDKFAGTAAGRDLDQTRSLLSMPSKNEVASAALERLNQNASRSAGIKSPLGGVVAKELPGLGGYPEGGLKAYMKGSEDDVLGGDAAPGKKKGKSKGSVVAGSDQDNGQGKVSTPEFQTEAPVFKPKLSRAERAKMITSSLAAGGGAFLAPGRKVTSWVGNSDDYKLVGNCLDCGKILCDQEGVGPCLVCGSEQIYIADTGCMLDGSPLDAALMAKRRRGGGVGEVDGAVDQRGARDEKEDVAFLNAMDQRDKLIDFEANRAARTTVIDDQSDFFDSGAHWLTPEQRARAKAAEDAFLKRIDERRRGDEPVTFNIDFAGRRIYGGDGSESPGKEEVGLGHEKNKAAEAGADVPKNILPDMGGRKSKGPTKDLMGPTLKQDMALGAQYSRKDGMSVANSTLDGRAKEVYEMLKQAYTPGAGAGKSFKGGRVMHVNDESGKGKTRKGATAALDGHEVTEDDVVDFEVEEGGDEEDAGPAGALEALFRGLGSFITDHADDQGLCMSMHQPWASLVVHGIKQVEGRAWPTNHRGRLWIASTKRRPMDSEVAAVLEQYEELKEFGGGADTSYSPPTAYPTSALLGCIDVVDCVAGEDLRAEAAPGEEATDCDYGFVLENPCRLPMPPRVLGQPKIYPLDPQLVPRMQKQLRMVVPM